MLQGENRSDSILQQIYERFIAPNETQPLWCEYSTIERLRELFPGTSDDCLELLQQMFEFDPKKRITAQQALEHRYY